MSKKILYALSIMLAFLLALQAEESNSIKVSAENYVDEEDHLYQYAVDIDIPFNYSDKSSKGKSSQPFRGIQRPSKKTGYTVSTKWLDEKAKEILDYYKKKKTPEDLYKIKSKYDIWKAFACKAFLKELSENLKDGKYENEEQIIETIKKEYLNTGLIYMHKYYNQYSVKKPPKFGSIKKYLQPMMTGFIYGNKWLVISELYFSSKGFSKKGQQIYINYFLDKSTMTIMRRRFTFPFKDNDLIWSILNMQDDIFVSYFRETIRRWVDDRQYRVSKFETRKKVNEVPNAFKGAEIRNDMP